MQNRKKTGKGAVKMLKAIRNIKSTALLSMIFLTGLLLVISVLCYSLVSLGWFSQNRSADVNGMAVTLETGEFTVSDLKFYPVIRIIKDGSGNITGYVYDTEAELHEIPVYDKNSIIEGTYKKALVAQLTCQASSGSTLNLSVRYGEAWKGNSPANVEINDNTYSNYISNCIQLRRVSAVAGTVDEPNQVEVDGLPQTFIDDDPFVAANETHTKHDIDMGNYTVVENSDEISVLIIIEYNEELVKYFCNGQNYSKVDYTNDLTFVIGSAAEATQALNFSGKEGFALMKQGYTEYER